MPKLPKLSDFTDVSGLMNKVKSAIDTITNPSSAVSAEALAKEKDPIKAQFLEIELLLDQLHEVMVTQNKIINEVQTKYVALRKLAYETLLNKEEKTVISTETTASKQEDKQEDKKE